MNANTTHLVYGAFKSSAPGLHGWGSQTIEAVSAEDAEQKRKEAKAVKGTIKVRIVKVRNR